MKKNAEQDHIKSSLFDPKHIVERKIGRIFEDFHRRMLDAGFERLPLGTEVSPNRPTQLLKKHEMAYRRKEGSNYFAFAHLEEEGLHVLFTNPGTSEYDANLAPSCVKIHRFTKGTNPGWAKRTVEEICHESAKKPQTIFFANFHDHAGIINGVNLRANNIDDGASYDFEIVRNLMLWNCDIHLGPTHHNHYDFGLSSHMKGLEASAGIMNLPAIELTLPYKTGAKNGPHLSVWFADHETAGHYSDEILSKRSGKYAPYAPLADPKNILEFSRKLSLD